MERVIRGTVSTEGKTLAGYGFKVVPGSAGHFTIVFTYDFEEAPSVVATIYDDGWNLLDNAHVTRADAGQCTIRTGDQNGGSNNRSFSFVACG